MITKELNKVLKGADNTPFLLDVIFKSNKKKKPVVIFSHGFKGFKDWGSFNQIANIFAEKEVVFIKYNFSHNGTTLDNPMHFDDLESFSQNNYTKELEDIDSVIGFVLSDSTLSNEIDPSQIILMGHSRGGGISIIKASEDDRISKVISWASVCDYENRMPKEKASVWKEREIVLVYNGRTKQQMPMHFQLYEDFFKNQERLSIPRATKALQIPLLIVHGDADSTVVFNEAVKLSEWARCSRLLKVKGADHVFGAKHPPAQQISKDLQLVVNESIDFIFKPF